MSGLTPAFIILLFSLTLSIFLVRKEHIIIPMIIAMCFLPADIPVKVGNLNFYALRILALAGIFRLYVMEEGVSIRLNVIDKLFLSYNILGTIIYIIASTNKMGAIIYKSGVCVDSIIVYLVFRSIIQSRATLYIAFKTLCICMIILMPFTFFEYFTANNLFSFLGRNSISIRGDEIRAATTFSHSILYGSFAAAVVPLLWAQYKITLKYLYIFGICCCVFAVVACSSSGPVVTLAGVTFFLFFFKWKQYSGKLAWLMLSVALFIHFVRESPLWHFLYIRITIKGSSTGYHRYLLTEAAVKEFKNWWLLGYGDVGPQWHLKYWPRTHAKFTDVTNHYLLEGVRGGSLTMILFIVLSYKVIKTLGTLSLLDKDIRNQYMFWGAMVLMIANCITFLSVAYFGQITMLLFLTIAIGSYANDLLNKKQSKYRNLPALSAKRNEKRS